MVSACGAAAPEAVSAPPPAPPEPPLPYMQVQQGEALGLHYLEVVLGGVPTGRRLPMVVFVHGRGDRPRVPVLPFHGVDRPVRLILPRAPDPFPPGYSWLAASVTEHRTALLTRSLRERSAWLASFIDHLRRTRPTRGRPIVGGFSQGGMLTLALAVHFPGVVGVAFPLAGWLPPGLVPEERPEAGYPPVRMMHAEDDPIVRFGPTRRVARRLKALGFDVQLVPFEHAGHAMNEAMDTLLEQWLRTAVRVAASLEAGEDLSAPSGQPSSQASGEVGADWSW